MARTRYLWDPESKSLVEVGAEWTDTERRAPVVTEELVYGKAGAINGVDISSRKKHREYLKANNLAMASDFTEHAPKVRREALARTEEKRAIRETVGRALYEARTQRKR
jgi:hypothetical protein